MRSSATTADVRRRLVAAGSGLLLACGLAACTGGSSSTGGSPSASSSSRPGDPSSTPAGSSRPGARHFAPGSLHGRIDALREGAAGDGRTDDRAALQAVLDAMAPGSTLVLPRGHVFAVGGILRLHVHRTTLRGPGTLRSTDEQASSLLLDHADSATVEDLTLRITRTTARFSAAEQQRLHVEGGTGVHLDHVRVIGSAAAGVFVDDGASDFRFRDLSISGTRADGLHMTGGSHDGVVDGVRSVRTGDDGVAVVSYAQDGAPCHDITVDHPTVVDGAARGISVVGGTDVTYRDIDVDGSAAAAVYIASESSFSTTGVSDVTVTGGRVRRANTSSGIDHGAVLLYQSTGKGLRGVTVRDLRITGTRATASRQVGVLTGGAGEVSDVHLDALHLTGGPKVPLVVDGPVAGLQVRSWTVGGRAYRYRATASS